MRIANAGKLTFQPFDEAGEVRIYHHGFLPHWRQSGCTYFVTWRLADSIPNGVLRQWKSEREKWLAARGIHLNDSNWVDKLNQLSGAERKLFERHFVAKLFAKLDEGLGECVLREPHLANEVNQSILYFHGERLDVGDFVIMPNHVHALLTPYQGFELEEILHSIKSYSSNQIQRLRKTQGSLWMKETHDHVVRDGEELVRIQEYIRANPEKAKLREDEFMLLTADYLLN